MKVYHGSYIKIDSIDLEKCEIGKDFGRGFYVTNIREQAEFWAERKGLSHKTTGCVTEFDFNENAFQYFRLKVLQFDCYNDEWLDFVATNRNPKAQQPTHDYDIVEGPVADDKIATRINDYLSGKLLKQEFLKELKFFKDTHQICFCTACSLQMLDYIENPKDISYEISKIGEHVLEQLMLDNNINELQATDLFYNSETFGKLAEESTKLYEKSWQEIYERLKKELETR
ncbi:MAG: DUF3990 domain-containing protein [Bacteroidales bacterium]|jgi:hypothetical protein|nr:DUF3990 domain-containing protein [Bacteroidales bacterium]